MKDVNALKALIGGVLVGVIYLLLYTYVSPLSANIYLVIEAACFGHKILNALKEGKAVYMIAPQDPAHAPHEAPGKIKEEPAKNPIGFLWDGK